MSVDEFLKIDTSKVGLVSDDPVTITLKIITAFLQILGILALVLVLYGGFTLLTSSGNPEKITKGRQMIIWAIIGVLVVASSLGILQYVSTIF